MSSFFPLFCPPPLFVDKGVVGDDTPDKQRGDVRITHLYGLLHIIKKDKVNKYGLQETVCRKAGFR